MEAGDTAALPFDIYQRYQHVAALLAHNLRHPETATILDVGGQQQHLQRFLPHNRIIVADPAPSAGEWTVQADGLHLPFKTAAVEAAISIDTLEHIPERQREQFVAELVRVAEDFVVLAFPLHSKPAIEAEKLARDCHAQLTGGEHAFLLEHHRNGLPTAQWLRAATGKLGVRLTVFDNGFLPYWLLGMLTRFFFSRLQGGDELLTAADRLYNKYCRPYDQRSPAYRCVAVLSRREITAAPTATPPHSLWDTALRKDLEHLMHEAAAFVQQQKSLIEYAHNIEVELRSRGQELAEVRKAEAWLKENWQESSRQLADADRELKAVRQFNEHIAAELSQTQASCRESLAFCRQLETDAALNNSALVEAQVYSKQVEAELEQQRAATGESTEYATKLKVELEHLRTAADVSTEYAMKLEAELVRHGAEINRLEELTRELTADRDDKAATIQTLQQLLQSHEEQRRTATEELVQAESNQRHLQTELQTLTALLAARDDELDKGKAYAEHLLQEVLAKERTIDEVGESYQTLQRFYSEAIDHVEQVTRENARINDELATVMELASQTEETQRQVRAQRLDLDEKDNQINELQKFIPLYNEAVSYARQVESELRKAIEYADSIAAAANHERDRRVSLETELTAAELQLAALETGFQEKAVRLAAIDAYPELYQQAAAYAKTLENELAAKEQHVTELEGYVAHLLGELKRHQE